MKLDDSVIKKIVELVYDNLDAYEPCLDELHFYSDVFNLDLVFKPGDSSQSVLVEQK